MSESPKNQDVNLGEALEQAIEEDQKNCQSDKNEVRLWDGGTWYKIGFSECDTHEKLTGWIYHLTEKAWVTGNHVHLFLAHVFSRYPALTPKF